MLVSVFNIFGFLEHTILPQLSLQQHVWQAVVAVGVVVIGRELALPRVTSWGILHCHIQVNKLIDCIKGLVHPRNIFDAEHDLTD